METFKEIASSIADWFKHRVVNPFFAAFIFSWLTINWRVVLCLTSDIPFFQKINWIDTKMYPKLEMALWYCLGQPLLLAGLYIFLGPHVFRYVMSYYRRQQNQTRQRLLLDDAVEMLPVEEGQRLKKQRIDAMVALHNERKLATEREQDLIAEIDDLRKQLSVHVVVPAEIEQTAKNEAPKREVDLSDVELRGVSEPRKQVLMDRGLTRDELQVVLFLCQREAVAATPEIAKGTKLARVPLTSMLIRLEDLDVVESDEDGYELTPVGQQIASHFLSS